MRKSIFLKIAILFFSIETFALDIACPHNSSLYKDSKFKSFLIFSVDIASSKLLVKEIVVSEKNEVILSKVKTEIQKADFFQSESLDFEYSSQNIDFAKLFSLVTKLKSPKTTIEISKLTSSENTALVSVEVADGSVSSQSSSECTILNETNMLSLSIEKSQLMNEITEDLKKLIEACNTKSSEEKKLCENSWRAGITKKMNRIKEIDSKLNSQK
ncbi:hypothetical protein K2X05_01305 [bacterium]|nr:hypothetical protein [bacterium]